MTISLFKNCAWLQQIYISIENHYIKSQTLNKVSQKILWKIQRVHELVPSILNCYNIRKTYVFIQVHVYKFETNMHNPC